MVSVCIVILLEFVDVHHQHHHFGFPFQKLQFHITAECRVIEKSCERIPAVGVFPVFQPDLRLILLLIRHHFHGIGFRNIRNDDLRTLTTDY